jgi:hypothetical protein
MSSDGVTTRRIDVGSWCSSRAVRHVVSIRVSESAAEKSTPRAVQRPPSSITAPSSCPLCVSHHCCAVAVCAKSHKAWVPERWNSRALSGSSHGRNRREAKHGISVLLPTFPPEISQVTPSLRRLFCIHDDCWRFTLVIRSSALDNSSSG